MLYLLLTGRRPFNGTTQDEVLDQVRNLDPRPMRSIDEKIPKELERICTKSMAKRAADRYSVANDMAADLRAFLAESLSELEKSSAATTQTFISEMSGPSKSAPATDLQLQTGATIRITPKGLRSFDAADSDFFWTCCLGRTDATDFRKVFVSGSRELKRATPMRGLKLE